MRHAIRIAFAILSLSILAACGEDGISRPDAPASARDAAEYSIQTVAGFHSPELGNTRTIRILLPASYGIDTAKRYPVLYVLDGHAVFSPGGPYGCWNLEQAYARLVREGKLRELIIVAIHNPTDTSRNYEYTPVTWNNVLVPIVLGTSGGGGPKLLAFCKNTLLPYVNRTYRTQTGPDNTAVMGSSFGGLFAFYAGWTAPETFGMAGVVSPGFFWGQWSWFNSYVLGYTGAKKPVRYWIDSGNREDFLPSQLTSIDGRFGPDAGHDKNGLCFMAEDAYACATKLAKTGWKDGHDMLFDIAPDGLHNEAAWGARVHKPLLFFFGTGQDWTPRTLALASSRAWIAKSEAAPAFALLPTATRANGVATVAVPAAGAAISSDANGLWSWGASWDMARCWRIAMNKTAVAADRGVTFRAAYAGLSASTPVTFRLSPPATVVRVSYAGSGTVYLRGSASPLSWSKGVAMSKVATGTWQWSTTAIAGPFEYKAVLNDTTWQSGANSTGIVGTVNTGTPAF